MSAASSTGAFHVFRIGEARKDGISTSAEARYAGAGVKRINILIACTECKKRKVRCDGQHPCGPCTSSSSSSSLKGRSRQCFYVTPRPRVIPTKKSLEEAVNSLADCRSVLQRLFPTRDVQDLLPLSREQLISLLLQEASHTHTTDMNNDKLMEEDPSAPGDLYCSPPLDLSDRTPHAARSPMFSISSQSGSLVAGEWEDKSKSDDESLIRLEQVPTPDAEWDEERRERVHEHIPAEADDVNALSFTIDRQVSYLGVSSIRAALLVMLKLRPALRHIMTAEPVPSIGMMLPVSQQQHQQSRNPAPPRISWSRRGQALVDAYFKRFHMYMPMLDEPTFRAEFAGGTRLDNPWQALANMVLALGSVAAGRSDDTDADHAAYYERAVSLLPLTALGSSHIETIQALALMGGEYLHYVNRPNMASGVLGAAIRMAGALGLHKQILTSTPSSAPVAPALHVALETRRRTWWSLFCLDTWATMLTGRPSFGRNALASNIAVTGGRSGHEEQKVGGEDEMDAASDTQLVRLLAENVKFARIATRIQDAFAMSPVMSGAERRDLDNQLAAWHDSQPWLDLDDGSSGETGQEKQNRVVVGDEEAWHLVRCLMKWRYLDLRILLHRPVLLFLANNVSRSDWNRLSTNEVSAVEKCLSLAVATVEDIERGWAPNQVSGWKAAWYLHQASMVPLLILLWNPLNAPDETILEPCRRTMPTILRLLEGMKPWSLTASRSCVLIGRIFEAAMRDVVADASDKNAAYIGDVTLTGRGDDVLFNHNVNPEQVATAYDFPMQQSLEFDLGLDFAFLGCEQDVAMAASLDSYSIMDPIWEESFSQTH